MHTGQPRSEGRAHSVGIVTPRIGQIDIQPGRWFLNMVYTNAWSNWNPAAAATA
jgi:hypothetical protein